MKYLKNALLVLIFLPFMSYAQFTMHNFTVTDVHGQVHRLYEDYLDKNKVVVVKFFFTTCPPCIANAPYFQQKYVDYGEGNGDVEFFHITTIPTDYDADVLAYENQYQQTMKGISVDGGARPIALEFKDGTYGSWYGTPTFIVIAPNRTLHYPVQFSQLDAQIAIARTEKNTSATTFSLSLNTPGYTLTDGHVKFYLQSQTNPSQKIEITKDAQGQYSFTYPSTAFPEMEEPEVTMESIGPAASKIVTAADLVAIQKHILLLAPFQEDYQKAAADINSDNKITAADLSGLRKVILLLNTEFPNHTASYKSLPATQPINPSNTNIQFTIVKTGNVN